MENLLPIAGKIGSSTWRGDHQGIRKSFVPLSPRSASAHFSGSRAGAASEILNRHLPSAKFVHRNRSRYMSNRRFRIGFPSKAYDAKRDAANEIGRCRVRYARSGKNQKRMRNLKAELDRIQQERETGEGVVSKLESGKRKMLRELEKLREERERNTALIRNLKLRTPCFEIKPSRNTRSSPNFRKRSRTAMTWSRSSVMPRTG